MLTWKTPTPSMQTAAQMRAARRKYSAALQFDDHTEFVTGDFFHPDADDVAIMRQLVLTAGRTDKIGPAWGVYSVVVVPIQVALEGDLRPIGAGGAYVTWNEDDTLYLG